MFSDCELGEACLSYFSLAHNPVLQVHSNDKPKSLPREM